MIFAFGRGPVDIRLLFHVEGQFIALLHKQNKAPFSAKRTAINQAPDNPYPWLSVDVSQLVVSLRHHAGDPDVDVHHHHHGDEEGAHGRENHVARVLVVATDLIFMATLLVPERKNRISEEIHTIYLD